MVTASRPSSPSSRHLKGLVEDAASELFDASAAEILAWAGATFGSRLAVASSMQDTVLVHLAAGALPGVRVLFLDTGYHFAETIGTRDAVAATMPVELVNVTPAQSVAEQDEAYGPDLHARDPDLCCELRKVQPLDSALAGYDAWVTGARRQESELRAATPVIAWDERREIVRLAPLAHWSDEDVDDYASAHGLLVNPLRAEGYPSIGCRPCTSRVQPGETQRSGRWPGFAKSECGVNL